MSKKDFNIMIAGDLFPSNKNFELFEKGDIDGLFDEEIQTLFQNSDFSICNLEGALTESIAAIKKVDPKIRASRKSIDVIKRLGVSCVTLANNHIVDYGKQGYLDTCETLEKAGINFLGAGEDINSISEYITIQAGEKKVVIYAVAETMFNVPTEDFPGVNLYDEYRVCKMIEELKGRCDCLIVLYHGGTEFFWYGTELLRRRFHRMADSGADIIIAQHTHCIGLTEIYNDSYLLYGQGDFLFARSVNEYKETGLLLEVLIDENGFSVKEHLLKHEGGKVIYDINQNFNDFYERNRKYAMGDRFELEYKEFSDRKIIMFLEAFRGKNLLDKVVRKTLPRSVYIKYLKKQYTEKQVLRMISAIQFEEFRESVIKGLWNMIE